MTPTIAQRPRDAAGTRLITQSAAERVRNVVSMTRRNLVHISREPMQLSDVTIQPVLFTVLFIYLFGGAIPIPGGGSYTDFILAGLLALNDPRQLRPQPARAGERGGHPPSGAGRRSTASPQRRAPLGSARPPSSHR
jgi:hypothetical protein